jgi:hypothetical protein
MTHPLQEFFSNSPESHQSEPSNIHPLSEFFQETKSAKMEVPKKEKNLYQKAVEEPGKIFLGNAAAGFRSLPRTAFELLKTGVKKAGGNIADLEESQRNAPEWLKKTGNLLTPTFEEVRNRQKSEMEIPEENTAFKRGLGKAGRFVGESPYFGGIGGIRGAAGIAGAAAGAQTAEELDLGPWANLGLTLGGAALGHTAAGGLSGLSRQRVTPEVNRYMEASRELGIDPLLTGMNPSQIQRVAQKWATHGIGGPEILRQAYESRSGQVSRAFEQALDEAGTNLFSSTNEAGQGLREGIQEATRQVERNKSQLYRAVDRTLPEDASITIGNPSVAQNHLTNAIDSLSDTLSLSPPESAIHRRATALLRDLDGLTDHLDGEIPIRVLESTNRSLNDIIHYDRPGGADKLLIPFAQDIRQTLDRYGTTNPQYATARRAANEYFANDVVHIRQNLLQSIARSERPESTLAIMNTVSGVRNVERALNSLPHGQRLTDSLKRYKLADLVRDKIIDPSTGLMKVGGLKNFLSKKTKDYDLLRELAGPRGIRTLGLLEHAGQGLERGFNNLVNPSKTADTLIALNSVLSPGKKIASGVNKFVKGNLIEGGAEALTGITQTVVPRAMSRMILDPDFARRVYSLSRAARENDWKRFNRILDSLDNELKKDEKRFDKYLNPKNSSSSTSP